MLFDKTLLFYENAKTAPSQPVSIQVNGSDYSRMFIVSTIGTGVKTLKLTVKSSDDGITFTEIASKTSTADEVAMGLMALPTPLEMGKYIQVIPTITKTDNSVDVSGMTCGIVDAVPTTVYFK